MQYCATDMQKKVETRRDKNVINKLCLSKNRLLLNFNLFRYSYSSKFIIFNQQ